MTTLPKNLMSGVFGLYEDGAHRTAKCHPLPNHFMLSATVLALLALTASGYGFAVSAEPVPTPLQQARYGVPAEDVECAGDRILMESPSGIPRVRICRIAQKRWNGADSCCHPKNPVTIFRQNRRRRKKQEELAVRTFVQNRRQAVRDNLEDHLSKRIDNHPGACNAAWRLHRGLGRRQHVC